MALGAYTIRFHAGEPARRQRRSCSASRSTSCPSSASPSRRPKGSSTASATRSRPPSRRRTTSAARSPTPTVEAVVYQQPFVRYWYSVARVRLVLARRRAARRGRRSTQRDADDRRERPRRAAHRHAARRQRHDLPIEARVVDASRREVRGEGKVRVMRAALLRDGAAGALPPSSGRRRVVDVQGASTRTTSRCSTTGTVTVTKRRWKERRLRRGETC